MRTEEQKAEAAKQRKEINEAKSILADFMKAAVFSTLDDTVQAAITRLAKKAASSKPRSSLLTFFSELFEGEGFRLDEFELFKATKIGRAEMRKKVHYFLKKAAVENRYWIRFDADTEEWVLDQIGGECPDNWTDADKPVYRTVAE